MKSVVAFFVLISFAIAKEQFFSVVEKGKAELIKKVFNHYDSDKSGAWSYKEYTLFYKEARQKHLQKRVTRVIASCDKNSNGAIDSNETISIQQRIKMVKEHKNPMGICLMLQEEFSLVDKDKNKKVTKEELLAFYSAPRVPLEINQKEQESRAFKMFKGHLKSDCDQNRDGQITLKEAVSNKCHLYSDAFVKMGGDVNKSIKISDITKPPKETINPQKSATHFLRECDEDGNFKLNLVEATSSWCMMTYEKFTKLDRDKNGLLNKNELINLYKKESKEKMPKIVFTKDIPDEIKVSILYAQCDRNKNREVSKEEAKSCKFPARVFNSFDYNKNGTIDKDDLEQIAVHRAFKFTDTNSDGKIDFKESLQRANQSCSAY